MSAAEERKRGYRTSLPRGHIDVLCPHFSVDLSLYRGHLFGERVVAVPLYYVSLKYQILWQLMKNGRLGFHVPSAWDFVCGGFRIALGQKMIVSYEGECWSMTLLCCHECDQFRL